MCQVGPLVCSARSPAPDHRASFPGPTLQPRPGHQITLPHLPTFSTRPLYNGHRNAASSFFPQGHVTPFAIGSHAHREALPRKLWLLGNRPRLLRPYVIAGHSFQPAGLHTSPMFPGRLPSQTLALIVSCTQTDPKAIFQRHQRHQV